MTLQEKIKKDMVNAMKTRETDVIDILRVAAGEFGRIGKDLADGQVIKVLRKLSETAIELGNDREAEILEKYLPQMLNETEIRAIVNEILIKKFYSGMKDMGKVMGELRNHPNGHLIDGKLSSIIVRELLSK